MLNSLGRRLADVESPESLSNRLRNARFQHFVRMIEALPRPLSIIDVGGTEAYWEQRGWAGNSDYQITIVNLVSGVSKYDNIVCVDGDATELIQFSDKQFDVAFSNSVIEHLFTYENQCLMSKEVQRVASCYWVQTPNFWFPLEPHFHAVGWHWLPVSVRIALIRRWRFGWRGPYDDEISAKDAVDEVRLMTRKELRKAFPGGQIWDERIFGLTKSLVVYGSQ